MNLKKLVLLVPLLIFLFNLGCDAQDTTHVEATAHSQGNWDLKRCVEYAVTNNISVKQADVQARLGKLTLDQSRLSQIPTLTGGVSAGINSGRFQNPITYVLETQTSLQSGLSLQSSVTVFNGFYLQRTIDANRYAWQALLANTELLKNNITLNVANAYLTVLLANQTAQAALLQSENATVGSVVENREIVEAPLNGREYLNLVTLAPNISNNAPAAGPSPPRIPSPAGIANPAPRPLPARGPPRTAD